MTILQRYVAREFLKIFALGFCGLLATYVLVDFFQRIDLFLNYPTPVRWKLLYFVLKMPLFVFHIAPVSLLVTGSLGATTSGTVVSNGASLVVNTDGTIAGEALTLNGAGAGGYGALDRGGSTRTNTWTGPVTLNTDSVILPYESSSVQILSGQVGGAGSLTKTGSGKLVLSGTTENYYSGDTFVNEGILELNKSGAWRAILNGTLRIGDGGCGDRADIVRLRGSGTDQIRDAVPLVIASSGYRIYSTSKRFSRQE